MIKTFSTAFIATCISAVKLGDEYGLKELAITRHGYKEPAYPEHDQEESAYPEHDQEEPGETNMNWELFRAYQRSQGYVEPDPNFDDYDPYWRAEMDGSVTWTDDYGRVYEKVRDQPQEILHDYWMRDDGREYVTHPSLHLNGYWDAKNGYWPENDDYNDYDDDYFVLAEVSAASKYDFDDDDFDDDDFFLAEVSAVKWNDKYTEEAGSWTWEDPSGDVQTFNWFDQIDGSDTWTDYKGVVYNREWDDYWRADTGVLYGSHPSLYFNGYWDQYWDDYNDYDDDYLVLAEVDQPVAHATWTDEDTGDVYTNLGDDYWRNEETGQEYGGHPSRHVKSYWDSYWEDYWANYNDYDDDYLVLAEVDQPRNDFDELDADFDDDDFFLAEVDQPVAHAHWTDEDSGDVYTNLGDDYWRNEETGRVYGGHPERHLNRD